MSKRLNKSLGPLKPINVVSVQTSDGRWQSRVRGHDFPVGEGGTSEESKLNLLISLPVNVEEKYDPGLE